MHQEKPAIGEVERRARYLLERQHVGLDHLERGAALSAEVGERLGAECAVDLDAGDAARGPDPIGHQPHDRAWARAHIEAAHAGLEADPVEHLLGRALPHRRLIAQTLILAHLPGMHVTVGIQRPRFCRHRLDLLIRCSGAIWQNV